MKQLIIYRNLKKTVIIKIKNDFYSNTYFFLPSILNIVVPQLGHLPFMALLCTPPLPFMDTSLASDICRFALHFTQYASTIVENTSNIYFEPFTLIYQYLGLNAYKSYVIG